MAQSGTTKKKSTASKSTAKAKSAPRSEAMPPMSPEAPIRREVGAFIFLFLAVFTVISCFNTEGKFILFFSQLIKGLIGWGFWLVAPAFLLVAIILGFHRGRPVVLRVSCALLLPILFAAIANLMLYIPQWTEFDLKQAAGILFVQGQGLLSGGVVGGLIAVGLQSAFSMYGAFPLLLASFLLCLITAFNSSVSKIVRHFKELATVPYNPENYEEPVAPSVRERVSREPVSKKAPAKSVPIVKAFDIPLGDDEDALSPEGPKYEAETEAKPAEHRIKVRKKTAAESAAKHIEPLPIKEAEKLAGISGDNDDKEFPIVEKLSPVTMSAELSDPPKSKKLNRSEVEAEAQAVAKAVSSAGDSVQYEYPPTNLLKQGMASSVDSREEIILNKDRLDTALRSFGINAAIVGVTHGPTVTRYDIELEQGVKLAKVTNLAGDLALALGVINVRVAPIPEKISTVGIEVPNKIVSTVFLRDIIDSPKFTNAKSKLSFALGKDIGGECIVGNISKLPHMLIAGTTGSGKSVCMNSLILSLLYKARPDEVRFIMIDPKMVELGVYNGIPHLYVPVVTDPKKAAGALQWSVVEMLKRYRQFSEVGVRDLESYNKTCEASGEPTMPRVVVVIDELADLMLAASKEVEESICRVAQMGRAAGMHLVIATQRPSADVITGLMKANIPSRIAFAVSSAMESRIILDQTGAEKLVGMGDMLFSPVGCGKPQRIQGAFVSDEERENVIQFIKEGCAAAAPRNSEIEEFMNKAAADKGAASKDDEPSGAAGDYDEMLPKAAEMVIEMKQCTVSMIQRRVKLGYARAARVVDQMEELGIVGPYEGAKPRTVLIDAAGWHDLQIKLGMLPPDTPEPQDEDFPSEDTY